MSRTNTIYRGVVASICVLAFFLPASLTAQTVGWQLKPADYTDIARFGNNLYQVVKDGRIGIIHADGTIVVPVAADNISRFYENVALVTVEEAEGKQCILGVLDVDGVYTPFPKPYYTLSGQEFFSDGVISVVNQKGKKGYVNKSGDAVCGFDKSYYRIKPFTEGYAAVSEKRGYYYLIDKHGEKKKLQLPDDMVGGSIGYVFNVWKGKALAIDTYDNFYQYDFTTGECRKMGKNLKEYDATDYLFRPKALTSCDETAPFTSLPAGVQGLAPSLKNGKYGFEENGKVILPCQLNAATPFEDGLSIVDFNGKKGILRLYADQQEFGLTAERSHIEFDAGTTVSCQFALQIPAAWSSTPIDVMLADGSNGGSVSPVREGSQYVVKVSPAHSMKQEYAVTISSEGLQLWTGSLAYTLKRKVVDLVINSLVLDADITDLDRKVTGSFVIYNPNEEEITANLNMTYSSMIDVVGGYPQSVVLKAGERKKMEFYIVTAKNRGKWEHTITVSSSKGGSATITSEVDTF